MQLFIFFTSILFGFLISSQAFAEDINASAGSDAMASSDAEVSLSIYTQVDPRYQCRCTPYTTMESVFPSG